MVNSHVMGVAMRCHRMLGVTLAVFMLGGTADLHLAAAEPVVDKCLAAPFYPDGSDLFRDCDAAIRLKNLDKGTAAKINLQLGQALYFAHRPGMAIPYLDEAIKGDPSLDQAWRRRGWSHLMMNHVGEAMTDFTGYLEMRPNDPDALFAVAYGRNQLSGDCAAATRDYEQILKQHPEHYITRFNLAGAYHCLNGNQVRQLEQYDKIIAAGRELTAGVTYYSRWGRSDYDFHAMVRRERSIVYFNMGRYDDAVAETTWLIAAYPRRPDGYINRSMARLQRDDHMGALMDAETALTFSPRHPHAQTAKLDALKRLKRNDEIIHYATEILRTGWTGPMTPSIRFKRGAALKRTGHKNEAIDDLNTAMAMEDRWVWAVQAQLEQSGYLFGPPRYSNRDPVPDFRAKPFANALEACMIDPECFKQ